MNIFSICVLAVVTVIMLVAIKPGNSEIAIMLSIACSVVIILSILSQVSSVTETVNKIIAESGINTDYIAVLLKVIGICLITEFAVNTCKDAGSQSLAGSVSLAGKIMITITSLPLYSDILDAVLSIAVG